MPSGGDVLLSGRTGSWRPPSRPSIVRTAALPFLGVAPIITVLVVLGTVGLLAFTRFSADIIFLAGLTVLLVLNILSPAEALAGLANEGMVTVGVLFVVVAGQIGRASCRERV